MLYKRRGGDGMNRLQFHSELTCDAAWYRLNVLLQSLAVCGAKRCEVRGELTDWGCDLRLSSPVENPDSRAILEFLQTYFEEV